MWGQRARLSDRGGETEGERLRGGGVGGGLEIIDGERERDREKGT